MTTNSDNNVSIISREEPSELMHYTNASGLKGILESQTLWATNALFLNDSEEIRLFFENRLPSLVGRVFIQTYCKIKLDDVDVVTSSLRKLMLSDAPPYILSMCSPDDRTQQNGLLSQWRGYGNDGGYALVFDRKKLYERLQNERQTFQYLCIDGGDVYYYDKDFSTENIFRSDNILEPETNLINVWVKLITEENPDSTKLSTFYNLLARLSCLYKHVGFQEEQEFRVFAIPTNSKIRSMLDITMQGIDKSIPDEHEIINELSKAEKKHKTFLRDGCPVPYIELIEQPMDIQKRVNLPIKRIIVGPNIHKLQRKKAVELVLSELGIDAEVVVSDIPYIGR